MGRGRREEGDVEHNTSPGHVGGGGHVDIWYWDQGTAVHAFVWSMDLLRWYDADPYRDVVGLHSLHL